MYILLVERPSEPLHLKIAESDLTQSTSMAPRALPFFSKFIFLQLLCLSQCHVQSRGHGITQAVTLAHNRAWHHPRHLHKTRSRAHKARYTTHGLLPGKLAHRQGCMEPDITPQGSMDPMLARLIGSYPPIHLGQR